MVLAIDKTVAALQPEFANWQAPEGEGLAFWINKQMRMAHDDFGIRSIKALRHFAYLSLLHPVLRQTPLPQGLLECLNWPGLPDEVKLEELENRLEN